MAALDTNVIVRWLVKDDAAQTARVQTLLDARLREQQTLFVPVTVLLETEWVLRSRYRFDKASITAALDALLSKTELEFESEPAAKQALWQFKPRRRILPTACTSPWAAMQANAHCLRLTNMPPSSWAPRW